MDTESVDIVGRLAAARVVPVLRTAETAAAAATRLLDAGLPVVELTATTPGWWDVLAELRAGYPDAVLGAGTVTRAEDARRAVAAGADFLVSPYPSAPVRAVAAETGVPFLEGGFTPAEVAASCARSGGRGVAKLFPAHLGGPRYLASLLAVLPGARIVPTGGIRLEEVADWLAAGALAVGVGSADPADLIRGFRTAGFAG